MPLVTQRQTTWFTRVPSCVIHSTLQPETASLAAARRKMSAGEASNSVLSVYRGTQRRQQKEEGARNAAIAQRLQCHDRDRTPPSYEASIEYNWGCPIQKSLPESLRPALRLPNGKRVSHERYHVKSLPAREWSRALKRSLHNLAKATPRDMDFAHRRIVEKVRQRQKTGTHQEYYASKYRQAQQVDILSR